MLPNTITGKLAKASTMAFALHDKMKDMRLSEVPLSKDQLDTIYFIIDGV